MTATALDVRTNGFLLSLFIWGDDNVEAAVHVFDEGAQYAAKKVVDAIMDVREEEDGYFVGKLRIPARHVPNEVAYVLSDIVRTAFLN